MSLSQLKDRFESCRVNCLIFTIASLVVSGTTSDDLRIYLAMDTRARSVISDGKREVVANVTVEAGPTGVAYDSDKHEVFVANSNYQSVSVIPD